MDSIEKAMKKIYPSWNSLTDEEKEIVNDIATQIPIRCEDVATIFMIHGKRDRQKTIHYIRLQYGFNAK